MTTQKQKALGSIVDILEILRGELQSILADELRILEGIPGGPESKSVSDRFRDTCEHLQRSIRSIEDAIAQITAAG